MARKVNTDEIQQIDEILKHEDPAFLEELKEIKSEDLKLAELEAAFQEAEKENTAIRRFWEEASPKVKALCVGGLLLVLSGPAYFAIWYYFLKPPPLGERFSLEPIADETYKFDMHLKPKSFFHAFLEEQFLFEVPDHVFYMRERRDIRIARVAFYLEYTSKEDLKKAEKARDEIIETLNEVFAKADVDSFNGIAGKENMKKRIMTEVSLRSGLKIRSMHFRMMVFN